MPPPRRTTDPVAPRLSLAVQLGPRVPALPAPRAQLRRWIAAALERDCMLTLRFVGTAEARALNQAFRGRDYATNVLTFDYGAHEPVQADIVVCLPVVRREARAQGKAFADHLAHLVVHGALHAQGWDHERGEHEAAGMEARERAILARFRIADPYGQT